jgi:hypothetical protein
MQEVIGRLERGEQVGGVDRLSRLATALEVEPCELLDGLSCEASETTEERFVETAVPGLGLVTRRFEVSRDSTRPSKEPSDTRSRMAEPAEAGSEAKN